MASIVRAKVRGDVYLYESVSFRNKDGKPRNKKTIIGKIDRESGLEIYKPEYIKRMKDSGEIVPENKSTTTYLSQEIKASLIKEFGAFYFYNKISENIGLQEILMKVFPNTWKEIFVVACYLVSTGDPMMYCGDWIEKTDTILSSLTSQEISKLLAGLTHNKQEEFYQAWCKYRSEKEYLALDITSISSYSKNITPVEWGYNRDCENLPQINLCMLLGETSRLPIFQMIYNGSLKDVSTLKTSLVMAFSLGRKKRTLVMDKGFYSKDNINFMIKEKLSENFLIAMPYTTKHAKDLIIKSKIITDNPDYTILLNAKNIIQGITKIIQWDNKHKLYAHVYYNVIRSAEVKNDMYEYVACLKNYAIKDPKDKKYENEFKKYLNIKTLKNGTHEISINQSAVENEIFNSGWMILLSNSIKDVKKALSIYRSKDAVEKGFYRLKNNLDLHRLRTHSDETMMGKLFIEFISLILMSHIHHKMTSNKMYKYYSLKELIKELEKLHIQYIGKNRILYPLTRKQKEILTIFDVKFPV
ncbi:IS4 family transposase [Spirochaetia bacterium]|nr:IS4 family transposase [Spirochaetia bacterium]